jgi:predicted DNA-binding transcriptional regulator AlpA
MPFDYLNFDRFNLSKRKVAALFGLDTDWVDSQIECGDFPPCRDIAGKPVWNAMDVYHWWAEIYLEPEWCNDEYGRQCTEEFRLMLSSLFND